MTTEKMNVHKALCELKTLEERISKSVLAVPLVFANKHSNAKVSGVSVAAFCEEIKSGYQKVNDLMSRRCAIKNAVVLSNAVTKVNIAGREYTVAEAIEMKNHGIQYMKGLLAKMERDNRNARNEADKNNGDALEARADEYIRSLYGNADMKNMSDEVKKVRNDFITAQTCEIIDPIGVHKEMERLEEFISVFSVEVDSALSVSNALTEIKIEY